MLFKILEDRPPDQVGGQRSLHHDQNTAFMLGRARTWLGKDNGRVAAAATTAAAALPCIVVTDSTSSQLNQALDPPTLTNPR